jgi:hypothetical protein
VKEISYGKQSETQKTTPEIEVMANAMFERPMHPGKEVDCFADMTQSDNHETSCAQQLHESPRCLSSAQQDHRTKKHQGSRQQYDESHE